MTPETVSFVVLVLCVCGAAVSSSICAVLLKREIETWWARNYGVRNAALANDVRVGHGGVTQVRDRLTMTTDFPPTSKKQPGTAAAFRRF